MVHLRPRNRKKNLVSKVPSYVSPATNDHGDQVLPPDPEDPFVCSLRDVCKNASRRRKRGFNSIGRLTLPPDVRVPKCGRAVFKISCLGCKQESFAKSSLQTAGMITVHDHSAVRMYCPVSAECFSTRIQAAGTLPTSFTPPTESLPQFKTMCLFSYPCL